jgi:hypothetical protein
MTFLIISTAAIVYFQISYLILNKISEHVKEPYMDEIFHVPQAQQYCQGNYLEVKPNYNFAFFEVELNLFFKVE